MQDDIFLSALLPAGIISSVETRHGVSVSDTGSRTSGGADPKRLKHYHLGLITGPGHGLIRIGRNHSVFRPPRGLRP